MFVFSPATVRTQIGFTRRTFIVTRSRYHPLILVPPDTVNGIPFKRSVHFRMPWKTSAWQTSDISRHT